MLHPDKTRLARYADGLAFLGHALAPRSRGAALLDGHALFVERYHALLQSAAPLPSGERTTLRRIVQLQAYTLARVVRGEQERYVGYTP